MIALLNSAILTVKDIPVVRVAVTEERAREIVQRNGGFTSFIGHAGAAAFLSDVLGVEVPVNRANFRQGATDIALVVTMPERPLERGREYSAAEMRELGVGIDAIVPLLWAGYNAQNEPTWKELHGFEFL